MPARDPGKFFSWVTHAEAHAATVSLLSLALLARAWVWTPELQSLLHLQCTHILWAGMATPWPLHSILGHWIHRSTDPIAIALLHGLYASLSAVETSTEHKVWVYQPPLPEWPFCLYAVPLSTSEMEGFAWDLPISVNSIHKTLTCMHFP